MASVLPMISAVNYYVLAGLQSRCVVPAAASVGSEWLAGWQHGHGLENSDTAKLTDRSGLALDSCSF